MRRGTPVSLAEPAAATVGAADRIPPPGRSFYDLGGAGCKVSKGKCGRASEIQKKIRGARPSEGSVRSRQRPRSMVGFRGRGGVRRGCAWRFILDRPRPLNTHALKTSPSRAPVPA